MHEILASPELVQPQDRARLNELQLHYLVRETSLPNVVKVYRLFIGGYDSKEELKNALGLAEQN